MEMSEFDALRESGWLNRDQSNTLYAIYAEHMGSEFDEVAYRTSGLTYAREIAMLPSEMSGVVFDFVTQSVSLSRLDAKNTWPVGGAKVVLRVALNELIELLGVGA